MDETTGFHPTVECVDNGGPLDGLYLASFSYDIARSVQRYQMGIYGRVRNSFPIPVKIKSGKSDKVISSSGWNFLPPVN